MKAPQIPQFDFGANWKSFSDRALSAAHVQKAQEHFAQLFAGIELHGRAFLDIGFGQGLTLLIAASEGAQTIGCDINSTCADVVRGNQKRYFPGLTEDAVPLLVGSILDPGFIETLRAEAPDQTQRAYDIVHSWGVLHHTGNMREAIRGAASLVVPGGYLVISIYARHWSSRSWGVIKRLYNSAPALIRRLLVALWTPLIYVAKWCVTRRNPLEQRRGMDFHHDILDWLGGYPYEYATRAEVTRMLENLGFESVRFIPANVPTGCNEFVFRRASNS